jgi:glycerophosphoryl diester phosphodiesterase
MKQIIWAALLAYSMAMPAHAFDLQGHRGARGLAPENTLAGFETALRIGVTTLEFDLAMTSDDVLVVTHDRRINPDITRQPGDRFVEDHLPAIRSLPLERVQQYDVGRIKPGTAYAKSFPEQRPKDGARIPTLTEVFDLVQRLGADHVRLNIETKITPTPDIKTPDPETFAAAVAKAVRDARLVGRVSVQSFDWRTLMALKRIAPEIERVCLTAETTGFDTVRRKAPMLPRWTAHLSIDDFEGSVPHLVLAAGCAVWSPYYANTTPREIATAKSLRLKILPWTVNQPADMERLIALGVDGIITDYPDRLRAVMAAREMPLPPQVDIR